MGKGENNSCAKLTTKEVLEIRDKYIPYHYDQGMLAKEYKTSKPNIYNILARRKWKHI